MSVSKYIFKLSANSRGIFYVYSGVIFENCQFSSYIGHVIDEVFMVSEKQV